MTFLPGREFGYHLAKGVNPDTVLTTITTTATKKRKKNMPFPLDGLGS
jgi:hypothetical protein